MTSTSSSVVGCPVVGAPTEIQPFLLDAEHGHQIISIQSEPNGRQRQYTCRLEKAVELNSVDKFCGDIRRRSGQPEEEVGPASETIVPWTSEPQPPLSAASSTQLPASVNSLAPTLAVWRCGSAVSPVFPTTQPDGAASSSTADGQAAKWLDRGLRGVTDRLWFGLSLSADAMHFPFNIKLDPMHVEQLGLAMEGTAPAMEVTALPQCDDGDDSALSRPTSRNKMFK